MKIRITLMFIFALTILTVFSSAAEIEDRQLELWGSEALEDNLQPQTKELMKEYEIGEQSDFYKEAVEIFQRAILQSGSAVKSAFSTALRILLIIVFCQIADSISHEKGKAVTAISGALAVMLCCAADLRTMIGLGRNTIQEITDYTSLLLPVMVSAATASGSLSGAGVSYSVAMIFSNLLMRLCNSVFVPCLYAYLSLSLTDTVIQQDRMKKLREMIGWGIEKALKGVVYAFIGFLSISGLLAGNLDKAAMKAAKATISGAVPVVGGIISGAADTVFASAVFLKNAIGTFGMLAILAMFFIPFINMGVSYLVFKLTAALGMVFESRLSGLLEAITSVLGYFLAMIAVGALISILTCCCLIRTVNI